MPASPYAAAEAAYAKVAIGQPKRAGQPPVIPPGLLGAVRWQQHKVDVLGDHGDEDRAAVNMARAIAGLPPVGPMAGRLPGTLHWFDGAGSGNIGLMEATAEYIRALRERDHPALARCRELFTAFFAISSGKSKEPFGWMLSEILATHYSRWHLVPIAALSAALRASVHPTDQVIQAFAVLWLRQWIAVARLLRAPSGRILYVGMRNKGHRPDPGFYETALSVALGEGQERHWLDASRGTGQGLESSWEYLSLTGPLRDALATAGAPVADAGDDATKILDASPKWPLWPRAELRIASWGEAGHAAWFGHPVSYNGNPLPGAVELNGEVTWLPTTPARGDEPARPGGERIVKGADEWCERDGGRLLYHSPIQGEQSADLPPGEPEWSVTWDHGGPRMAKGWAE